MENLLIGKLEHKPDILVIETLAYMRSKKSLPVLYGLLKESNEEMFRIIIASSIFQIAQDRDMIEIAKSSFEKLEDKYQIIASFYYLISFQDSGISSLINGFTNNSDHLIANNAKRALGRHDDNYAN